MNFLARSPAPRFFVVLATSAATAFVALGCSSNDASSSAPASDSGSTSATLGTCMDMTETPAQLCADRKTLCPTGDTAAAALTLLCSSSPFPGGKHPIAAVDLGCHSLIVYDDVEDVTTYTFADDDTTLVAISSADDTDHVVCYSTPGARAGTCARVGATPSDHFSYDQDCPAADAGADAEVDARPDH